MCYRSGDPVTGQRNYTYMDAIKANLGKGLSLLVSYLSTMEMIGFGCDDANLELQEEERSCYVGWSSTSIYLV